MPSFHKSKENRLKDMKKRFQYNPQPQVARPSSSVGKQKISDIIIRDQNGEFSSVKERNDFNDSSWLAKLVNGIQECDNLSIRPSSELLNLQSLATQNVQLKSQPDGQVFTITRKNSDSGRKTTGRKSVPCISSQRVFTRTRENSKSTGQALAGQSQNKKQKQQKNEKAFTKNRYQKRMVEQSNSRQELKKLNRNMSDRVQGKLVKKIAEEQPQNHKNSLINYSSIQEDERNFDTHKEESPERIIIDLDQISLKTEVSKEATPIQTKAFNKDQCKFNESKQKDSIHKTNRRRTSSKLSDGSKEPLNYIKIENKLHSTPVGQEKLKLQEKSQKKDEKMGDNESLKREKKEGRNLREIKEVKEVKEVKEIKQSKECKENKEFKNILKEIAPTNIVKQKLEEKESYENEFLDTFKHYSLKYSNSKVVGAIKKNNLRVKPSEGEIVSRLDIKDIAGSISQEARIPTFSERPVDQLSTFVKVENIRECPTKKGTTFSPIKRPQYIKKQQLQQKSMSTIKKGENLYFKLNEPQREVVCQQFTKQSPKFNYFVDITKPSENRHFSTCRIQGFQELFSRLDSKKERKIYKYNCKQESLNQQEKYEIGSILSKIRYMGKEFTEKQFVQECCRLFQGESSQSTRQQSYHTFQPTRASDYKQNIPHSNVSLEERKTQNRKYLRESQNTASIEPRNSFHEQHMKNDKTFIPLFPETLHTQTENLGPRRSPYLEMPSLPGEHEKSMGMEMKGGGDEKSDIGNIIDNLNSKLSNYIQTNNLEDTYRKFKLEFVQLRRNMPY